MPVVKQEGMMRRRFFSLLRRGRELRDHGANRLERRFYYAGVKRGRLDCYDEVNLLLRRVGRGIQN